MHKKVAFLVIPEHENMRSMSGVFGQWSGMVSWVLSDEDGVFKLSTTNTEVKNPKKQSYLLEKLDTRVLACMHCVAMTSDHRVSGRK